MRERRVRPLGATAHWNKWRRAALISATGASRRAKRLQARNEHALVRHVHMRAI